MINAHSDLYFEFDPSTFHMLVILLPRFSMPYGIRVNVSPKRKRENKIMKMKKKYVQSTPENANSCQRETGSRSSVVCHNRQRTASQTSYLDRVSRVTRPGVCSSCLRASRSLYFFQFSTSDREEKEISLLNVSRTE